MQQLRDAFDRAGKPIGPTPAGTTGHDVHFYRTEESLTTAVVDFLADGLRAGQPIVVIATPAHREAFAAGLRARGLDTDKHLSGRVAVWLDARETLSAFMERRTPDRELFMQTIGRVFERLLDRRENVVVRGYGEMVDLLATDGNFDGAIVLERLWNELAAKHPYSLLCGYRVENFLHDAGPERLVHVCQEHSRTLPIDIIDGPEPLTA